MMLSLQFLKKQYKTPGIKMMGMYTVTNFFGKGLSFLLLPLFTNPKYLSPADNGLLSLFSQAIIFILPFVSLGILQSASVDYFKLDKKNFKDFCTTGFFMALCMSLISFIAIFLFRNFLFKTFSFPSIFIWAIPLTAFMGFCYELLILLVRNNNDTTKYMKINMLRITTELGLALIFIVALSWHWYGRVASILVASASVVMYAVYYLIKNEYLAGTIQKKIIYNELKYSGPVIAFQLSMFCLASSDSFLLAGITKDNAAVGIYGMACVFGTIIITLSGALIQYIVPKINKALSSETIDFIDIRKQMKTYVSIMIFTFLTLLICVPAIYHSFINEKYWAGIRYYYFLSAGYFFWTITVFFCTFLLYYKKKKQLFILAVNSLIISLSLNYFLIKRMASFGASVSVCCSYFLVMLLTIFLTKNHWKPLIYYKA